MIIGENKSEPVLSENIVIMTQEIHYDCAEKFIEII